MTRSATLRILETQKLNLPCEKDRSEASEAIPSKVPHRSTEKAPPQSEVESSLFPLMLVQQDQISVLHPAELIFMGNLPITKLIVGDPEECCRPLRADTGIGVYLRLIAKEVLLAEALLTVVTTVLLELANNGNAGTGANGNGSAVAIGRKGPPPPPPARNKKPPHPPPMKRVDTMR